MSHSVSKLNSNYPISNFQTEASQPAAKPQETESRALVDFIVDQFRDMPRTTRPLNEAQHTGARRKVFSRLVSDTLTKPGHPFSGIKGKMREEMIQAITEELVHSHYSV